jgi:hypothetical protein
MHLTDDEISQVHERLFIFAAAGRDCVIVSNEGEQTTLRLQQLIDDSKGSWKPTDDGVKEILG